jgi:hypothetical protein
MLDYVYGHDQIVAEFVAELIPHCRRGFGPHCKAIGVIDRTGRLLAGIVYYNYDPEAEIIEIAGAAMPKVPWLTRDTLRVMYQYPFLQCHCQMVVQRTPADDERLLGMLAAYGYSFVTVPRLFGRERDGVICSLTYEDWINNRFNKRLKHHLMGEAIEEAA